MNRPVTQKDFDRAAEKLANQLFNSARKMSAFTGLSIDYCAKLVAGRMRRIGKV